MLDVNVKNTFFPPPPPMYPSPSSYISPPSSSLTYCSTPYISLTNPSSLILTPFVAFPPQNDGKKAIDVAKNEVSCDILTLVPLDKSPLHKLVLTSLVSCLSVHTGVHLFACMSIYLSVTGH